MDSRKLALTAYRVMAYVTGTGLVVLVCIAMPLKYFADIPKPTAIVGALHGFFYMAYVVCTLLLAERCRWSPLRAVLVALAGTVPFASFYAERKVTALVRAMGPMPAKRAGSAASPAASSAAGSSAAGGAERAADQ